MALVAPQLLKRWGTPRTLTLVSAGICLSMLVLATLPHRAPATIGFIGVMAMAAMGGPARNIFSQEVVPPRWRTTMSAITTIGLALGWASTAAVGGYLIAYVGFGSLFALAGLLAFIAALLLANYVHAIKARGGSGSGLERR